VLPLTVTAPTPAQGESAVLESSVPPTMACAGNERHKASAAAVGIYFIWYLLPIMFIDSVILSTSTNLMQIRYPMDKRFIYKALIFLAL
jgi:hypothetical protein